MATIPAGLSELGGLGSVPRVFWTAWTDGATPVPKNPELPAMLFYVDDFVSDGVVEAMSTEQVGAYMLLLCKAWRENPPGTIPDNDEVLARWSRLTPKKWIACRSAVLRAFEDGGDGRWHQKRMKIEYERALKSAEKRSHRAKRGAASRWNDEPPESGDATSIAQAYHKHSASNAQAMLKHEPSNAYAMLKNAYQIKQSQTKPSINGQGQAKDSPLQAPPFDFDRREVEGADWLHTFADFNAQLDSPGEDRRLLAQLAWLVCAGAPILASVRDGLDGITAMRKQGQSPSSAMAYLSTCLSESIGANNLAGLLAMAPPRNQCSKLLEGL